jgi:hypothetical protein
MAPDKKSLLRDEWDRRVENPDAYTYLPWPKPLDLKPLKTDSKSTPVTKHSRPAKK